MHWTRFRALAVIGTAMLFAACQGQASPTINLATSGPSVVETSAAPSASEAAAASAAASIDVSAAGQGLSNLTSYKVSMTATTGTLTTFTAETTVIRQPSPASSFTETSGAETFRVVIIGTDIWLDQGSGKFVKNPPGMTAAALAAMTNAFDPGTVLQQMAKSAPISSIPILGVEQKNGVSAAHLHADSSTQLPAGASPIPAGATFDLWVATEGNFLVALEANGLPEGNVPGASAAASGALSSFQVEVTNVNDSSLTVSPPA